MNVIARLEYELAYYDFAVHHFNHYTTRTSPAIFKWQFLYCFVNWTLNTLIFSFQIIIFFIILMHTCTHTHTHTHIYISDHHHHHHQVILLEWIPLTLYQHQSLSAITPSRSSKCCFSTQDLQDWCTTPSKAIYTVINNKD